MVCVGGGGTARVVMREGLTHPLAESLCWLGTAIVEICHSPSPNTICSCLTLETLATIIELLGIAMPTMS